jgi:hypothetical protein
MQHCTGAQALSLGNNGHEKMRESYYYPQIIIAANEKYCFDGDSQPNMANPLGKHGKLSYSLHMSKVEQNGSGL